VIELVHIADFTATVGAPIEIGRTAAGLRRVIPITGGEATGPKLRGRILYTGADFQIERADGVAELHARYVLETDDGALIYIENSGLRHGSPEAMEKLRRGEPVDPSAIYCRTTPRFETAAEPYRWLTRHLFVASAIRRPHQVELAIYQIL
jgi:Protein of unknown function (DUF3237)